MKKLIISLIMLPLVGSAQLRFNAAISATSELGTFAIDAGIDYYANIAYFGAAYRAQVFVSMPDVVQGKIGAILGNFTPYLSVNYAIRNLDKWPPIGNRLSGGFGLRYYSESRVYYFADYSQRRIYVGFGIGL